MPNLYRILSYSGPADWLEDSLNRSAIGANSTRIISNGKSISEVFRGASLFHAWRFGARLLFYSAISKIFEGFLFGAGAILALTIYAVAKANFP